MKKTTSARMVDGGSWRTSKPTLTPLARSLSPSSFPESCSPPIAYQRGVGFLLRSQLIDGSWLVRSRTYPFQPYKESGYPHGKHQWLSAAGSSWAAMALTLATLGGRPELSKLF